jgi:hypothetical protein
MSQTRLVLVIPTQHSHGRLSRKVWTFYLPSLGLHLSYFVILGFSHSLFAYFDMFSKDAFLASAFVANESPSYSSFVACC